MATAYVITEGEYSDYRILAVFTSKALADKYVARANPRGDADGPTVEEWPINVAADFKAPWEALIVLSDEIQRVREPRVSTVAAPGKPGVTVEWSGGRVYPIQCLVIARAATAERAAKVATEQAAHIVAFWDLHRAEAIKSGEIEEMRPVPEPAPPKVNELVSAEWFCTDCGSGPTLLPVAGSPEHRYFAHHAPSCTGKHDPEVLAKALEGRRVYGRGHL